MTFIIEPSTFGIGYSIFRMKIVDGKEVKVYVAEARTVAEAKGLVPIRQKVILEVN